MDWMDVKPGDKVARISAGMDVSRTYTVERLTKTQIVLAGTGVRLRRSTGRELGGWTWSTHRWSCDPAEVQRVAFEHARRRAASHIDAAVADAIESCESDDALARLVEGVEAACAAAREGV